MTLADFAVACVVYCMRTDAYEEGGFRPEWYNDLKKGVAHSPHLYGLGRDVKYHLIPPEAEAKRIAADLGLLLIREVDYDHLQPAGWQPG